MTPGDDLLSPRTTQPATGTDVRNERAVPQPTILSTVWDGPTERRPTGDTDESLQPVDPEEPRVRPRLLRWLSEPTTRRRALIISAVAAVACGGLLAVGQVAERPPDPSAAAPGEAAEAVRGRVRSESVAGDTAEQRSPADVPGSITWEAVSADDRIRFTAVPLGATTGGWLLEATMDDPAETAPVVRFTVNGVVVDEVDQPPYRLDLSPELLGSFPNLVDDGRPLVVTASVPGPGVGQAAGPATLVLPN